MPLIEAFKQQCPLSVHLICFSHCRENIKTNRDLSVPSSLINEYVLEIFGGQSGTTFIEGLADAMSENDFDVKLASLEDVWNNREQGPALTIGKLGNCLGPQSHRGPRVLTAKQNFIGIELCISSMQLHCICISYFYSNIRLFLNKHSFIIFISEILSAHTVKSVAFLNSAQSRDCKI